jgi:hypothetical protein
LCNRWYPERHHPANPQNDGLHGDRELPEQVANALPVPASRESDRSRRARKRAPKTPGAGLHRGCRRQLIGLGNRYKPSLAELDDLGK